VIAVSEPSLTSLERDNLLDAFDSGWISSRGKYIEVAESALRRYTSMSGAAVVSSGTTALHLALVALGLGPGDEVIIPSATYAATLNAVLYVGATPVVVDVDDATWCIDVDAVGAAITPATAAVIAVDLYGQPADYTRLRELLGKNGPALVADAAESIGGSIGGAPVGSLADITTFSFFGNKVVTSGEGGALVTATPELLQRILQLRNQGNHSQLRYHHDVLGYNYRMTNLSAAILAGQLARLPELLALRSRVCAWYDELLQGVDGFVAQAIRENVTPSPWLYTVRLAGFSAAQRDNVIEKMAANDVETRPAFCPVQSMPYAPHCRASDTPVADRLANEGISLPTHPGLSRKDVETVVVALVQAHRALR
jgi:perosamine synthetase